MADVKKRSSGVDGTIAVTESVEEEYDDEGEICTLNEYVLGDELGHGSFGVVRLATRDATVKETSTMCGPM